MIAGTVFKSTDGGGIWAPANTGLPSVFVQSLVIDPSTPSTIYAGHQRLSRVFKSTDGGGNWAPATHGLVVLSSLLRRSTRRIPLRFMRAPLQARPMAVFKSTNAAVTGRPVGTGLPNGIVAPWRSIRRHRQSFMPAPSSAFQEHQRRRRQ